MCKPFKEYLGLLREYTREVFTFGGIALFVWQWCDVRDFVEKGNENNARTAEILRELKDELRQLDARAGKLEEWHALEAARKEK